jgi:hypothetical protein
MISAFSSRQRMVLGQRKVADKSNEITAIPELLDLLTVKGAIVTIDAPMIGVGMARATPPSEPCKRFSRTRLSGRWFLHRDCLATVQAV